MILKMKLHEMYFDTIDECIKNRDEYDKKNIWFCPLIKDACHHDCICYKQMGMVQFKGKFLTHPSYCCYKPFNEE